ncbi:TetR/AcrR family transcriptional regulator [Neobacillus sp. D3-1R]|uniref:TetR/AcrR family transcriptional regulator n=1 Tax=Neobacillus sp. D3-1R TaxID=3445778 RepID=UPI003F9EEF03
MNDRKRRVVKIAHQLFIEKGFQATSIQDILDESGISKGTFYNYFSSKNELLVAIFKSTYEKLEKDRDELLIGGDRSDIEIFVKQVELQMKTNRENRLISLLEEITASNDPELKPLIEVSRMKNVRWLFERFNDIFGEDKKPYLLDCSIMFLGILRENIKFYQLANDLSGTNLGRVIRYSVNRLMKLVDGLAETGEQLIPPDQMDDWFPVKKKNCNQALYKEFHQTVGNLKKAINGNPEQSKYDELLDFILDELLDSKHPRKFLVESTLISLKKSEGFYTKDIQKLDRLIHDYFHSINQEN